jgi:hypothetical protein
VTRRPATPAGFRSAEPAAAADTCAGSRPPPVLARSCRYRPTGRSVGPNRHGASARTTSMPPIRSQAPARRVRLPEFPSSAIGLAPESSASIGSVSGDEFHVSASPSTLSTSSARSGVAMPSTLCTEFGSDFDRSFRAVRLGRVLVGRSELGGWRGGGTRRVGSCNR